VSKVKSQPGQINYGAKNAMGSVSFIPPRKQKANSGIAV
jgi:hypothetical protein